jgi:hypothetical protein
MNLTERNKLKQDAKAYIQALYMRHRQDDIASWSHLIDVIFLYIDATIEHQAGECGEETKEQG